MKDFKYCPHCRTELDNKELEGRTRGFCGGCKWIYYKNPLPAVATLVLNKKGELLLVKRAIEPFLGEWCIPGGFLEIDETVEEAGIRELKEETDLSGVPGRNIGFYVQKSDMYESVLIAGIEVIIENEKTVAGDDAQDARFFSIEKIPEIKLISHKNLIHDFLDLVQDRN